MGLIRALFHIRNNKAILRAKLFAVIEADRGNFSSSHALTVKKDFSCDSYSQEA